MEKNDKIRLCFLICGLPRSIDLLIMNIESKFDKNIYDIDYNICSSLMNDNEYCNHTTITDIVKSNTHIKNILLLNDHPNTDFRNSINYCKKITNGLKLIESNYNLYFIIRSDFIFENIDFIDNIKENIIYFSMNNNNCYTKNIENKINEQIIICSNYYLLSIFNDLYSFSIAIDNTNYADIIMFHFLKQHNTVNYDILNIKYKLILSKCNIIAISGDSGSGKTTLMNHLQYLYGNNNTIQFETDRYHKWERGDLNYTKYTHLNPYSNHLEIMNNDVYNLKIGNMIHQVDYNHTTGKFTDKETIESKHNVILCGLHTLYNNEINKIIDLKIFMDTERDLIKKWKINRDIQKRGYTIEQITKQIEDREKDYYDFIDNQKHNSDVIIRFYESTNCLKCLFIIKSKHIFDRLSRIIIKYNYSVCIENNNIHIELLNNYTQLLVGENIKLSLIQSQENNYYNEILVLFILYLCS